MIYLEGIGIKGYRSIGKEPVLLYPFKKVNLFIGPNNSGKSNLLRYIEKYFNRYFSHETFDNFVDSPDFDTSITRETMFPKKVEDVNKFLSERGVAPLRDSLHSFYEFDETNAPHYWVKEISKSQVDEVFSKSFRYRNIINSAGYPMGDGDLYRVFKDTYDWANYENENKVIYIEACRDLYDKNRNTFIEGNTIIEKLNEIINNRPGEYEKISLKHKIEEFISDLLGETIQLKIPSSKDSISIVYDGDKEGKRERSIEQLGSGVHEIIYFAIVATANSGCLICIDEPEIHMHPRLQRMFLDYLISHTDNQYFIATHSSAFLNTNSNNVSVFRTRMVDGYTQCDYCFIPSDYYKVLDELGCKASDILQTNCVIWVEGPSDRIYLNYWLNGFSGEGELIEGIDYSIMFYGGRLLANLTGSDDENEFISLLKLNRNSFIIIDSDKKYDADDINSTKGRILKEFDERCWITSGREIENYLPNGEYEELVRNDAFGGKDFSPRSGQYDNRLKKDDGSSFDKVLFARKFTEKYQIPDLTMLDLEKRVNSLKEFINEAKA